MLLIFENSVLTRILWFTAQWPQALKFLGHLKQRMGHKSSLSLKFPTKICVILHNWNNIKCFSWILLYAVALWRTIIVVYLKKLRVQHKAVKKIDCLFITQISLFTTKIGFLIGATVLHLEGPQGIFMGAIPQVCESHNGAICWEHWLSMHPPYERTAIDVH